MSTATVTTIDEMTDELREAALDEDIDLDALNAYIEYGYGLETVEETLEAFRDAYIGKYSSRTQWAEELLDDTGELDCIPERLRYYFYYEAYAQDCELGGDIWTADSADYEKHIFWTR